MYSPTVRGWMSRISATSAAREEVAPHQLLLEGHDPLPALVLLAGWLARSPPLRPREGVFRGDVPAHVYVCGRS